MKERGVFLISQGAGLRNQFFPLECRARIGLVSLNVIVAEDTLVGGEFGIGQFLRDYLTIGTTRNIAGDLGKNFCEGGGEFGERGVLLRRKIVLDEIGALHDATDGFRAGRAPDEVFHAQHRVTDASGDRDDRTTGGVAAVPFLEGLGRAGWIGSHVGDLDADGAIVGSRGVTGAFFEIERLVNRAVQIQHEVHAQAAVIMQNVETGLTKTADIVMQDELIDDILELRKCPATPANFFNLRRRKRVGTCAITVGCGDVFHGGDRLLVATLGVGAETAFDPVSVVAARIHPRDDRCAGMKELARDNDFIAVALDGGARDGAATREQQQRGAREGGGGE